MLEHPHATAEPLAGAGPAGSSTSPWGLSLPRPASAGANLEIFDVTIRDGSYTIDFQFTQDDIRFLCGTLERLGFHYIEVGHGFGLNAAAVKGASAGTDEEYLAAAAQSLHTSVFGAFFIPGIGRKQDLLAARRDFGMHFVRIGQDPEKIDSIIEYVEYAKQLGYEVMANFMKSYSIPPRELAAKAKLLRQHGVDVIYVVDSAGGMLPDEVGQYVRAIGDACDARIGFHGHNNLELASANAIAAYRNGCTLLDCSIGGLGRSAGNTRTEMLLPALRRMGIRLDYDLPGVFHVLDTFIAGILRRKTCSSEHIAGGYALVHSGMMQPLEDLAAKYGIALESLLLAYGDAQQGSDGPVAAEPLARQLAAASAAGTDRGNGRDNVLLQIGREHADPCSLHCSFMAVEKLLAALNALARKATLPIVLLVRIEPLSTDPAYVMAEYLYHDDLFIVARVLCSSTEGVRQFLDAHHREFDVLVFEDLAPHARQELAGGMEQWRRQVALAYASHLQRNYHYLFSILYAVLQETSGSRVLLFGANPEEFALHIAPEVAKKEYYCAFPDRGPSKSLVFFRLDVPTAYVLRDTAADGDQFEAAILFSHVSRSELAAIADRLAPGGVVLNCAGQDALDAELLQQRGFRQVPVDLRRAISGELINLLRSQRSQVLPGAAAPPEILVPYPPDSKAAA
jgi:4-hydroxy 2-oxovalerate aldolase/long-chain acyl-CoA synthetase